MPTYRTNGAWGSGIGVNLTPAQVDENFYDHETRIVSLETTPPTANSIETITASGFTWTIRLTDGTILDPLPVPVVYTVWRGDWQPFTLYSEADLFRVSDQGIFAVMQAHTSAATFDPDAAAGSPLAPLYLLMIALSSLPADTTLDEISDVTITGVADNDFIAWDAGSSLWTNRTAADVAALLAALTALDDLSDVDATAPTLGQVLTWQGSPARWQPADVAATLDELTDVSVPAPGDGDVLTYQAGSPTGWIAAPVPDIPSALDDLTDVAAPTPADGDFLQYQSGSPAGWVNAAGTGISDLASVSLPLLSTDLILVSEGVGSPPSSYQTRQATIGDLGFTLGSTPVALGATVTTVAGLTISGGTLSGTTTLPGSGQISSAGLLYLGANTDVTGSGGPYAFTVQGTTFGTASGIFAKYSNDTAGAFLVFNKSRGTTINSYTTVNASDTLAVITARGADGANSSPSSSISFIVDNTPASGIIPGRIVFNTVTDAGVSTIAGRINRLQNWSIGSANAPTANLTVGATAGTARIYNTFTDASNGEWAYLGSWGPSANVATFGTDKNGSGTTRNIQFYVGGTNKLDYGITTASVWTFADKIAVPGGTTPVLTSTSAITSGAAAAAGTLLNAPAAGDPTKWIPINDNGTTRYIPAW